MDQATSKKQLDTRDTRDTRSSIACTIKNVGYLDTLGMNFYGRAISLVDREELSVGVIARTTFPIIKQFLASGDFGVNQAAKEDNKINPFQLWVTLRMTDETKETYDKLLEIQKHLVAAANVWLHQHEAEETAPNIGLSASKIAHRKTNIAAFKAEVAEAEENSYLRSFKTDEEGTMVMLPLRLRLKKPGYTSSTVIIEDEGRQIEYRNGYPLRELVNHPGEYCFTFVASGFTFFRGHKATYGDENKIPQIKPLYAINGLFQMPRAPHKLYIPDPVSRSLTLLSPQDYRSRMKLDEAEVEVDEPYVEPEESKPRSMASSVMFSHQPVTKMTSIKEPQQKQKQQLQFHVPVAASKPEEIEDDTIPSPEPSRMPTFPYRGSNKRPQQKYGFRVPE